MNLSKLFITRPVMTTLVMIGILIFGIMSYFLLPISALPSVEYPFISVSASLPGGTPETMASSVAAPLERQFTEIAGLNSFNSTSSTGSTSISLQFDFSRSVASAAKDVQSAISSAAGQLPADMPKPPTYRKVNPSVSPILYLYLYSETLPISEVDENAEIAIAQPISAINGVSMVKNNMQCASKSIREKSPPEVSDSIRLRPQFSKEMLTCPQVVCLAKIKIISSKQMDS
jgi:HAE1 family hydrophobic/amphiphilic exporter-1